METIYVLITSIVVFMISLYVSVKEIVNYYNECNLVNNINKNRFSETRLDISALISVISLFTFILSVVRI